MADFFDREYTAKQAYGRLYRYAKKYRGRLIAGLLAGSITAGSWVPIFQVIQPILKQVQRGTQNVERPTPNAQRSTLNEKKHELSLDGNLKELVRRDAAEGGPRPPGAAHDELPSWFGKAEKAANRLGITLRDQQGNMTGELLVIALFVVPLVMLVKMVAMYLNHYCLRWVGARVVQDFRLDLFRHLQKQGLHFFGRTDVGQVMSRCTSDPQQVDHVISHTLADLCRAPFEILVSVGFVLYFALKNGMIETLVLVLFGFPLILLPMAVLGSMVRKWSRPTTPRRSRSRSTGRSTSTTSRASCARCGWSC
jgi:ABC-type multidrug transport system fused ATPase/permease subunit